MSKDGWRLWPHLRIRMPTCGEGDNESSQAWLCTNDVALTSKQSLFHIYFWSSLMEGRGDGPLVTSPLSTKQEVLLIIVHKHTCNYVVFQHGITIYTVIYVHEYQCHCATCKFVICLYGSCPRLQISYKITPKLHTILAGVNLQYMVAYGEQ